MTYTFPDFIGNLGVTLIVLAYFGLLARKVSSESIAYSLTNLIGAVCILVSLLYSFNLSSFIIELFWISISLYGLFRCFRRRRE